MRHHILGDKGVEEGDEQMKDLTLDPPLRRRNAPSKISPRFERQAFCFNGRIVGSDEIGMILAPLALLLSAHKLTQVGIADLGNVDVELPGRLQNIAAQAQVCRALARWTGARALGTPCGWHRSLHAHSCVRIGYACIPSFVHSANLSFQVGEQAKPPRQATRAARPRRRSWCFSYNGTRSSLTGAPCQSMPSR